MLSDDCDTFSCTSAKPLEFNGWYPPRKEVSVLERLRFKSTMCPLASKTLILFCNSYPESTVVVCTVVVDDEVFNAVWAEALVVILDMVAVIVVGTGGAVDVWVEVVVVDSEVAFWD